MDAAAQPTTTSSNSSSRALALVDADAFHQGIPFMQVDAFTRVPFKGNPAAVVCLPGGDGDADDAWMAGVAREMNLAETAFVTPREARLAVDSPVAYELDFPLELAQECDRDDMARVAEALGTDIKWLGINRIKYYLAELSSASAVRALRPDFSKLKLLSDHVGIIATALTDSNNNNSAGAGHDYVSRFFAPNVGVDEASMLGLRFHTAWIQRGCCVQDPVTGSAHCTSGPYWARKLNKDTLLAYQCSARGGEVRVRVDWERQRAVLQGDAVTTLKGVILPQPKAE
eukprot:jgi/Chlat1/745/Chrsp104S01228